MPQGFIDWVTLSESMSLDEMEILKREVFGGEHYNDLVVKSWGFDDDE